MAAVISTAKTSCSRPATAFPSSISESISASCRSEALGLHLSRLVPELHERLGHDLDERRGAADVDVWPLRGARADLREHLGVDAAREASPAGRLGARQRVRHRQAVAVQPLELLPE